MANALLRVGTAKTHGISATVESLDASRFEYAQVDEGAMSLATTAAIFYVWVYKRKSDAGRPDARRNVWLTKGRELIGKYLTEAERRAAAGIVSPGQMPIDRLRYGEWYTFLARRT